MLRDCFATVFAFNMLCAAIPTAPSEPQPEIERRGCCSHHKGVCGCEDGRVSCCDGTTSPTCEC